MASGINCDRSDAKLLVSLFRLASAQDGVDSQRDLTRAERLGHIIISSKLQADNSINLFRLGRQHHDRNVTRRRITLQNLAYFQTGHFRQHEIENDESRLLRASFIEAGNA